MTSARTLVARTFGAHRNGSSGSDDHQLRQQPRVGCSAQCRQSVQPHAEDLPHAGLAKDPVTVQWLHVTAAGFAKTLIVRVGDRVGDARELHCRDRKARPVPGVDDLHPNASRISSESSRYSTIHDAALS